MKNCKNVPYYLFGQGSISNLLGLLSDKREDNSAYCVYCLDRYFNNTTLHEMLPIESKDVVLYIPTETEPSTEGINLIYRDLQKNDQLPFAVIGIGGGITLDTAKAIANLLTNHGNAEDYQGWDLVKKPGIYKIGIPTISGTGAESSRTCVMTNSMSGLKLGMNSDYTIYDQLILDPDLTASVPRNQYFFTGMDSYIHCLESLNGSYRNAVSDAFSAQSIKLCRDVFSSEDMKDDSNREKLMVASYLGGCAIAHSYVGVVHPFSAGLSVVLGIHHGIANCMVMTAMAGFYAKEVDEFLKIAANQRVEIPSGVCKSLTDEQYVQLYHSTIMHEKPLCNALGDNFKKILTMDRVIDLFKLV
jgi:3-deoxy-alpha-D-manno-octulosonate 8-oxidase